MHHRLRLSYTEHSTPRSSILPEISSCLHFALERVI
jgi:hypothetical protein